MIQYALECIGFQLLFLIIYDVILKRETFFQWNRLYLIGTYILSLALPWIKIEALKTNVAKPALVNYEYLWNSNDLEVVLTMPEETPFFFPWKSMIIFGGMVLALAIFLYKLYQIQELRRKGEVHYLPHFTRVIIKNSEVAFSFFKSIFLGDKVVSKEHESIIQHELVHIKQGHSYDLVFFEILRIVNWFNPLVYVYQSRISELHEFIADAQVAKTHKKEQYQLLLSQVFEVEHISFINPFFKSSLIKKRIVMLQKTKSKKVFQLKYLLLVPLLLGMLFYTSMASSEKEITSNTIQNEADAALIKKVQEEIDKEVFEFGSISAAYTNFYMTTKKVDIDKLMTKEHFFKSELYTYVYYNSFVEKMKEERKNIENLNIKIPPLSTQRYNEYVKFKQAFLILDDNLKISISAYSNEVILLDSENEYPKNYNLVKVKNVKDLTGVEIREFNGIIDDISKNNKLESIVLTDGTYSFHIYQKKYIRVEEYEAHKLQEGSVTKNGSTITYQVADVQNLTSEEIAKRKELVDEILNSDTYKTLVITDGKMKTLFSSKTFNNDELEIIEVKEVIDVPFSAVDEVPIFPGCENAGDKRACFQEKMYEHISKNFKYPLEAQEKGIQGKVNLMFVISENGAITNLRMRGPSKLLEDEASRIISRLPKMKPGKQNGQEVRVPFSIPITFKLQVEDFTDFKEIPANLYNSNPTLINTINKYNELVKERNRLLKNVDKKNPVIRTLDDQLVVLKIEIRERLNTQSLNMNNQISEESEPANFDEATDVPFLKVEEAPIFPGCENAVDKRDCFQEKIYQHISKNFRYPLAAQELGIQGKVNTMFIISKDGTITNIKLRGPSKLLEDETERILLRLPKMTPGKQKGKEVNVPFSMPVTFKLQGDNFDLISENFKKNNPSLKESIDAINNLILERRSLLKSSSLNNPIIVALDNQIDALRSKLDAELSKK